MLPSLWLSSLPSLLLISQEVLTALKWGPHCAWDPGDTVKWRTGWVAEEREALSEWNAEELGKEAALLRDSAKTSVPWMTLSGTSWKEGGGKKTYLDWGDGLKGKENNMNQLGKS